MGLLRVKFADAERSIAVVGRELSAEEQHAFEERAAIAEFDGQLSRSEAEALARTELEGLRDDRSVGHAV